MVSTNGHYKTTAFADGMGLPPQQYQPQDLQPHNVEAEEALIGALLIDQDAIIDVNYLEGDDFYLTTNGWIYQSGRVRK